jgi:RNA polymerase sigma factor (sigma-70 family)
MKAREDRGVNSMAISTMSSVLQHLRKAALLCDGGGMTDSQLLECILARHEEGAFEALVRRHGPMVLGVCRRLLPNEHDAEDAFQATFLVLARKAASVEPPELVGNWLYGVAYRTALKARAAITRRRVMERQMKEMPELPTEPEEIWHDLRPLLDHELEHLPDKYRVPVVLCELEGRPRTEVARHLGLPEGTLSSRLATARKMLAQRLARRGLALSAGSLALVLSQNGVSACVPDALVGSTVKAATLFTAGPATAGVMSAKVATLTEGMLQALLTTRLQIAIVGLLALCVIGTGAGVVAYQRSTPELDGGGKSRLDQRTDTPPATGLREPDPTGDGRKNDKNNGPQNQKNGGRNNDKDDGKELRKNRSDDDEEGDDHPVPKNQGVIKALDASKDRITLTVRQNGKDVDRDFNLGKDVKVLVAGKVSTFTDVKVGMRVVLNLSRDEKVVREIKADGQNNDRNDNPRNDKDDSKKKQKDRREHDGEEDHHGRKNQGVVKAIDASKDSISVTVRRNDKNEDRVFHSSKNVQVFVAGKASTLTDLRAGMRVALKLSKDTEAIVLEIKEVREKQGENNRRHRGGRL